MTESSGNPYRSRSGMGFGLPVPANTGYLRCLQGCPNLTPNNHEAVLANGWIVAVRDGRAALGRLQG